MVRPRYMRIPRISTVVMILLMVAGCSDGGSANGMSTDSNMTDDAAVDDVLGANDSASNASGNTDEQL